MYEPNGHLWIRVPGLFTRAELKRDPIPDDDPVFEYWSRHDRHDSRGQALFVIYVRPRHRDEDEV